MKKIIALFAIGLTSLTPLASIQAQSSGTTTIWDALSKSASLENTKTMESIYGNFEVGDGEDIDFIVDYKFEVNTAMHNAKTTSTSSQVKASVTVTNQKEANEYGMPFKKMTLTANGELMSKDQNELYLKLDDLILNLEGATPETQTQLDEFKAMASLVKGHWYHVNLAKLMVGGELGAFDEATFMKNFKINSKQAIKDLVKQMITEEVKSEQYYAEVFGDEVSTLDVAAESEDYQTYLTDEVKQHPVDLMALVQKGVLECGDDTYTKKDLENGFQYPSCWPSVTYDGVLTQDEETLTDQLYAYSGEWIFEDGKWYYVETNPSEEAIDYKDIVSPEEFDYDEKGIETEVNRIMRGMDTIFEGKFFNQMPLISGPNQGFQFYNLNRANILKGAKDFGRLIGEEMTPYDEEEVKSELRKIHLAGIYHVAEDKGVIDNFFARFQWKDDSFLKNFEMNYQFNLTDSQAVNSIQVPKEVTELENLDKLMY